MERKKFKSIIAAVTAILIFIVPMLSVVVSAKNDTVPRIWIHGFMNSKVYEDVSDPKSQQQLKKACLPLPSWL